MLNGPEGQQAVDWEISLGLKEPKSSVCRTSRWTSAGQM